MGAVKGWVGLVISLFFVLMGVYKYLIEWLWIGDQFVERVSSMAFRHGELNTMAGCPGSPDSELHHQGKEFILISSVV